MTFAAGETEKTFTLSAIADTNPDNTPKKEGIEWFSLTVNPDPDGAANGSYVPVDSSSAVMDKKKEGIDSFNYLRRTHCVPGP